MKKSPTNETTNAILSFLFNSGIFAWRQNSGGIPLFRDGILTGFRPGGKTGIPDICGISGPNGRAVYVEVKTGKDRCSDVQLAFHSTARRLGAICLVAKDFNDFLTQWNNIYGLPEKTT
jgi:hypothetical protein